MNAFRIIRNFSGFMSYDIAARACNFKLTNIYADFGNMFTKVKFVINSNMY